MQAPSFAQGEQAYLEASAQIPVERRAAGSQQFIEVLSYHLHQRMYKKVTELFLEFVQQLEAEGQFPDTDYVFDHGVLSCPLTRYLEQCGKCWLSELEKSRNVQWKGQWRRLESIDEELRSQHPEALREVTVTLRNGERRPYWAFREVLRLKRYGKKRIFIVHGEADLSDEPQFLVTNALHWENTKAIQTWDHRWTSERFHEFGKQGTGLEAAQVRKEEAVTRHFRLNCGAQSILQRVPTDVSTSEKFAFAEGKITCGQRVKAIIREVFRNLLTLVKYLFEGGKSCQHVLEMLMPA